MTPVIVVTSPAPLPCEVVTPSGTIVTPSTTVEVVGLIGEMTMPGPTVMVFFVPLRSCSTVRFLYAAAADADGIGIAEGVGVGGTAIALQERGRPEHVAVIQGDGVAVGIPLRHAHAGGDVIIPQLDGRPGRRRSG